MTIGNEFLQKGSISWRVPIATLLLAAGAQALASWSPSAANGLATMVLIGAAITPYNGKTPITEFTSSFNSTTKSSKSSLNQTGKGQLV